LERGAFAEQDEPGRVVGQETDVAGVALLLQRRDQSGEIDEGRLKGVIDDLAGWDRDRLAPVFRLGSVLHASSRLGCFHLLLRFRMISALSVRLGVAALHWGGLWLGRRRRRALRRGRGRLPQLGDSVLDGFASRALGLRAALAL